MLTVWLLECRCGHPIANLYCNNYATPNRGAEHFGARFKTILLKAGLRLTMNDDELETEELDPCDGNDIDADDLDIDDIEDVDDVDEDSIDDSLDDGSDAVVTPSRVKSKAVASADELPSVEAKQKERDALAKAMEEFLARGGKVQEVENNIDV